jgi:hypothetical protein
MFVQPISRRMVMKNGLLTVMFLALVVAIPACRRGDCLDNGCNPCKPVCCKKEKVRKPRKCCKSFCDWFRCKPRCQDEEMMEEEEVMMPRRNEVVRERVVREDMAPAPRMR